MASDLYAELLARSAERLVQQRLAITVPVQAPAAGAEWSVTVPGGMRWELISASFRFVASAVVANRRPQIRVLDADGNIIATFGVSYSLAAGSTNRCSFIAGLGNTQTAADPVNALPDPYYLVPNGWTIVSSTGGIDPGDQYSQVFLRVAQWSETDAIQACEIVDQQIESYFSKRTVNG